MNKMEISWCLSGQIEDGYLIADSSEKIKIRGSKSQGTGIWKCVPITSSTGVVVSIQIQEKLEQIKPSICVGRVTQITRRNTILVKVSPSRKIYFHTSSQFTLNEVYQLEFEFRDCQLHVLSATKVDVVKPQTGT
jgi:hypothetical protein